MAQWLTAAVGVIQSVFILQLVVQTRRSSTWQYSQKVVVSIGRPFMSFVRLSTRRARRVVLPAFELRYIYNFSERARRQLGGAHAGQRILVHLRPKASGVLDAVSTQSNLVNCQVRKIYNTNKWWGRASINGITATIWSPLSHSCFTSMGRGTLSLPQQQ